MRGMKPCIDFRVPLITACGGDFPLMRSPWCNVFMRALPRTLHSDAFLAQRAHAGGKLG